MPGQFKGNRGTAQEYISSMIAEGLTNAQIVGTLRDYGLSYRNVDMYADTNRIRLEQFAAQGIKDMSIYKPVPESLMKTWEGDTSYKYRVVVQYNYMSESSGEMQKGATTLYYNERPSVNNVLDDWGVRVQTLEGGYGSTTNIQRIDEIQEINYFVNRPKR